MSGSIMMRVRIVLVIRETMMMVVVMRKVMMMIANLNEPDLMATTIK